MLRILVVDDETMHRKNLILLLRKLYSEHVLLEASDGRKALEELGCSPVDIIITDIRMPNMDGIELLSAVRKEYPFTKVIILSVFSEFSYAKQALRDGALDYVLKPVIVDELKEALDKAIIFIRREQAEKCENDKIRRKLDETFLVYMEHTLNNFLRGVPCGEEDLLSRMKFFGKGYVLLCGVDADKSIEANKSVNNFKTAAHRGLSPHKSISCQIQNSPFLLAVIVLGEIDRPAVVAMKKSIYKDCGFSVMVAVGSLQEDIEAGASVSFRHAFTALQFLFYENNTPVYSKVWFNT
ncbi:MAG: response regulator, partial [Treponema sp.]|nr:response regulator [Treponema sp.]